MKIKVKPPRILDFPYVGIVQLIFEPRGSKMNLHIFQRNSREKVRDRVREGQRKNSDRETETEKQNRLKLLAWQQERGPQKSCSFPSWGGFSFPGSFLFFICVHTSPSCGSSENHRCSLLFSRFQNWWSPKAGSPGRGTWVKPGAGRLGLTHCLLLLQVSCEQNEPASLSHDERKKSSRNECHFLMGMPPEGLCWGWGGLGKGVDSFGDRTVGGKMIQVLFQVIFVSAHTVTYTKCPSFKNEGKGLHPFHGLYYSLPRPLFSVEVSRLSPQHLI